MKKSLLIVLLFLLHFACFGQNKLEFDGQVSGIGSYSPDAEEEVFLGLRYLPELSYSIAIDSLKNFDFEVSANVSGSMLFHPFDEPNFDGTLSLYRAWARYTVRRTELRIGLQKIDFGAATILRPIQWFNQIDPRDPLQLTNGVYGALGRYYFLNNANIWLWALYGNEKTRGFDSVETNKKLPEFGGRIQVPVPKGEIALSYHYRTANSENLDFVPQFDRIPENRIGLDGKWDVGVGLWFEAAVIHKSKNLGLLTNQALFNLGTDYTFGIGSGLNVVVEHLVTTADRELFAFENRGQITATSLSYPLGFYDNLTAVFLYNWTAENFTFNLNYLHQFKKITSYLTVFYNPSAPSGIQQNDLISQFTGPGLRLTLVFNH